MNGADCDEAYKQLDMGKWATVSSALNNIFAERLPINTGTITPEVLMNMY